MNTAPAATTTATATAFTASGKAPELSFDVRLDHRAMFTLPDAANLEVICETGSVWITLDNDPRDIVLEPHQHFTTPEHRTAVVYALEASKLSVVKLKEAVAPCRNAVARRRSATPNLRLGWGKAVMAAY